MPDENTAPNSLAATAKGRSQIEGDVPEGLHRRYYVDGRGGAGLGFYVDATITKLAFRDQGRQLTAEQADPNTIRDMATIARHRGWTAVMARGSKPFRREAWLAGRTIGLEVRGYRPTERDVEELDRRIDRRLARQSANRTPVESFRPAQQQRDGRQFDAAAQARLRVVEAVVRDRVLDPAGQMRIVAKARERIAKLLEAGVRLRPLDAGRSPKTLEVEKRRERTR